MNEMVRNVRAATIGKKKLVYNLQWVSLKYFICGNTPSCLGLQKPEL